MTLNLKYHKVASRNTFLFRKSYLKCFKLRFATKQEARIYKEGWTERAKILCKLDKSLLESSKSVGIDRQKSLYSLKNLF